MEGPKTLLQLNASNERGASSLVPVLHEFLVRPVVLPRHLHRLVLLDEADRCAAPVLLGREASSRAQPAARGAGCAATAARRARCNDAIHTRMQRVHEHRRSTAGARAEVLVRASRAAQGKMAILKFEELCPADVLSQLSLVCAKEGLEMEPEGLREVLDASDGDMRRALNIAQAVHAAGGALTRGAVHEVSPAGTVEVGPNPLQIADVPSRFILRGALAAMERGELREALAAVLGLLGAGFAAFDILKAFRRAVDESSLLDTSRVEALVVRVRERAPCRYSAVACRRSHAFMHASWTG